jgi:hypothetical protein
MADVHSGIPIAIADCSRIHFVAGRGVNVPANGTFRKTVTAKYTLFRSLEAIEKNTSEN